MDVIIPLVLSLLGGGVCFWLFFKCVDWFEDL